MMRWNVARKLAWICSRGAHGTASHEWLNSCMLTHAITDWQHVGSTSGRPFCCCKACLIDDDTARSCMAASRHSTICTWQVLASLLGGRRLWAVHLGCIAEIIRRDAQDGALRVGILALCVRQRRRPLQGDAPARLQRNAADCRILRHHPATHACACYTLV
jgi:hypothetical protein